MRPKYGAVSFDVIDAVNARLAAADSGQPQAAENNGQSNETLFSRMRIETSVENAPQIFGTNRATVEATIEQPPPTTPAQDDKSKPPTNNSTKSQKSLTLSTGGKRYQNGSKRNVTATFSTNAIATENPAGDNTIQRKNQTIVSRWQGMCIVLFLHSEAKLVVIGQQDSKNIKKKHITLFLFFLLDTNNFTSPCIFLVFFLNK
jgi:hypothetical protein